MQHVSGKFVKREPKTLTHTGQTGEGGYYLGQYVVVVGSRLPHDRTERRLVPDLTERRLAALLLLLLPPRGWGRGAVAVSHKGNGPEIVGRPGTTPFFVFARPAAGLEPGGRDEVEEGGVDEDEEEPKSHLKLKNPLSPRAFFGGGGDRHVAPGSRASRPGS